MHHKHIHLYIINLSSTALGTQENKVIPFFVVFMQGSNSPDILAIEHFACMCCFPIYIYIYVYIYIYIFYKVNLYYKSINTISH